EGAAALPGARDVALAHEVPLGYNSSLFDVFADVPALASSDGQTTTGGTTITPGYLATMGIRLLEGRDFTARDDSTAPPVVLVNAALAGRLWPDGDWVGRTIRNSRDGERMEVIGVVGNVKQFSVREPPRSFIYLPFGQHYESEMTLHVRTASEAGAEAIAAPVRALVAGLDPALPVYDVKTMHSHLHDGLAFIFTRLAAALASTFGLLALVQAVVGLYGLLAYGVSLRAREFGVRLALGARSADVLRTVLGSGLRLTVAGVGMGLALAILATRYLAGLLNGVSPTDPVTFGGAAAVLVATALAAAYLPARRAARVSPAEALRDV
ncbi:MAG: ABC transporter permease, partial [Gemmatimonadaceae bacterium]